MKHIAQNQQIKTTVSSGIIAKIPPLFNELISWFKYEELTDDWLDLAVLEAGKRGPALKNGLVGDAEMYEARLDREYLRAADGVKYFRNTLGPHFIKDILECVFLSRFHQFNRVRIKKCRDSQRGSASIHCLCCA